MAKKAKKRVVKKVTKKPVILPMKLSSLIAVALKDVRKAENTKSVVVEMSNWFEVEEVECRTQNDVLIETHNVCNLCAAGSVMAFSLGKLGTAASLTPTNFPKNERQLEAINELREGNVSGAIKCLYHDDLYDNESDASKLYRKACELNCHIPDYDRENPEPFHKAMIRFKERLQRAGL